jgi:hypothetical protein
MSISKHASSEVQNDRKAEQGTVGVGVYLRIAQQS